MKALLVLGLMCLLALATASFAAVTMGTPSQSATTPVTLNIADWCAVNISTPSNAGIVINQNGAPGKYTGTAGLTVAANFAGTVTTSLVNNTLPGSATASSTLDGAFGPANPTNGTITVTGTTDYTAAAGTYSDVVKVTIATATTTGS